MSRRPLGAHMLSDDQFAKVFATASQALTSWAATLQDCATIETEAADGYWRLHLVPHAAGACPVEVIVHRGTQSIDVLVGPEGFEGWAAGDLSDLQPWLAAICDGHVRHRTLITAAGSAPVKIETEIEVPGRLPWKRSRWFAGGERLARLPQIARETHWLPYRRSSAAG